MGDVSGGVVRLEGHRCHEEKGMRRHENECWNLATTESRITLNITEHKHGRESNREGGRKREEEKKSRREKKGSKKSEKRMNNGWN